MNYQELKQAIEQKIEQHNNRPAEEKRQQAMWMAVGMRDPRNWREAKKAGMKKEGYYGWLLVSTSTNDDADDLYFSIAELCVASGLPVKMYSQEL